MGGDSSSCMMCVAVFGPARSASAVAPFCRSFVYFLSLFMRDDRLRKKPRIPPELLFSSSEESRTCSKNTKQNSEKLLSCFSYIILYNLVKKTAECTKHRWNTFPGTEKISTSVNSPLKDNPSRSTHRERKKSSGFRRLDSCTKLFQWYCEEHLKHQYTSLNLVFCA